MPVLICFFLVFVLAGVATLTTFRLVSIGCVLEKTLLQQRRINANQDGYTYTVQVQGLYNPIRFCGQMRAWMRVDLPALGNVEKDQLSVMGLSLWDGSRKVAALPPRILTYPVKVRVYSVTLATAWGEALCSSLKTNSVTFWSSNVIMTESVCG